MYYFFRVSRWAGLLLIPYLLWVSFAVVLNASIWHLNR
jgi:benzodiazapine receptor